MIPDIEGVQGGSDFISDDSIGHGSHVAGSIAGSLYDDWTGPADCPVGDATDDQTSLSCVGKCMSPTELSDAMSNRALDIDALCPDVRSLYTSLYTSYGSTFINDRLCRCG